MFSFDHTDLQRFAVSTLGALILSAACIISAVGPARAEASAVSAPTCASPVLFRLA
jgi:hypothetical protein